MLQEIVFQGVFECLSPVRLDLKESFVEAQLPSTTAPRDMHTLLTALFYPRRLNAEQRKQIEYGHDTKLAVTFESSERSWRILRRDDADSLRLQMRESGGYKDMVRGADVQLGLQQKLKFAPYPIFFALTLWRFEEPLPVEEGGFDLDALTPRVKDIVLKYKLALDAERLEDDISRLEERADDARSRLGEGAKLADKLEKARAKYDEISIAELSKEDIDLLSERDERLQQFEHQLRRLEEEEEQARADVDATIPDKPWRDNLFWAGLAIAFTALIISVVQSEELRLLAAADVVGFGMTAWVLLRYFTDMERASVHIVRLDSIKRRLNQVREEQVAFTEKIGHLLIHAGVEDEAELNERFDKSTRLKEIIDRMEEQSEKVEGNPSYQVARTELDDLEAQLDELRAEREEMGENLLSSYQLESDLENLDIDPAQALASLERGSVETPEEPYDRDEFTRLREVADRIGLFAQGRLDGRVTKMWAKICSHVIGPRFDDLGLSEDGELEVGGLTADQLDMWSRTRPREVKVCAAGLATALAVNLPSKVNGLPVLCIPHPAQTFSSDHASKFISVLKSASQKTQVILISS